ncbi:DNA repair protein RecO [Candidatus Pelagibacter sp. HIMB1483]|uniref:DNA repair protein RecO n=1 Tax=Candidatus Pelagibacter sp. HIMB1483 TaxID=3415414 RepID=UPI003F84C301
MIWDDTGFLLSKNKYNENSIISEIYTKNHGKVSGIIFGGTSKKIKNYLQIGNEIHVNFNSKSDNKIGYFKVEILKALSPIYFENPQKLLSILSAMQLVKLLTADYQTNKDIYILINKFYLLLNNKDWIKEYIFWELELFKLLGYDLDLKDLVDKKLIGNEFKYVSKSSIEKKIIPNFLVDQNVTSVDIINLQKGLKFVGDYLEKTILKPNNLNQPSSRLEFISTVK